MESRVRSQDSRQNVSSLNCRDALLCVSPICIAAPPLGGWGACLGSWFLVPGSTKAEDSSASSMG